MTCSCRPPSQLRTQFGQHTADRSPAQQNSRVRPPVQCAEQQLACYMQGPVDSLQLPARPCFVPVCVPVCLLPCAVHPPPVALCRA
jgi:hypothetical protein